MKKFFGLMRGRTPGPKEERKETLKVKFPEREHEIEIQCSDSTTAREAVRLCLEEWELEVQGNKDEYLGLEVKDGTRNKWLNPTNPVLDQWKQGQPIRFGVVHFEPRALAESDNGMRRLCLDHVAERLRSGRAQWSRAKRVQMAAMRLYATSTSGHGNPKDVFGVEYPKEHDRDKKEDITVEVGRYLTQCRASMSQEQAVTQLLSEARECLDFSEDFSATDPRAYSVRLQLAQSSFNIFGCSDTYSNTRSLLWPNILKVQTTGKKLKIHLVCYSSPLCYNMRTKEEAEYCGCQAERWRKMYPRIESEVQSLKEREDRPARRSTPQVKQTPGAPYNGRESDIRAYDDRRQYASGPMSAAAVGPSHAAHVHQEGDDRQSRYTATATGMKKPHQVQPEADPQGPPNMRSPAKLEVDFSRRSGLSPGDYRGKQRKFTSAPAQPNSSSETVQLRHKASEQIPGRPTSRSRRKTRSWTPHKSSQQRHNEKHGRQESSSDTESSHSSQGSFRTAVAVTAAPELIRETTFDGNGVATVITGCKNCGIRRDVDHVESATAVSKQRGRSKPKPQKRWSLPNVQPLSESRKGESVSSKANAQVYHMSDDKDQFEKREYRHVKLREAYFDTVAEVDRSFPHSSWQPADHGAYQHPGLGLEKPSHTSRSRKWSDKSVQATEIENKAFDYEHLTAENPESNDFAPRHADLRRPTKTAAAITTSELPETRQPVIEHYLLLGSENRFQDEVGKLHMKLPFREHIPYESKHENKFKVEGYKGNQTPSTDKINWQLMIDKKEDNLIIDEAGSKSDEWHKFDNNVATHNIDENVPHHSTTKGERTSKLLGQSASSQAIDSDWALTQTRVTQECQWDGISYPSNHRNRVKGEKTVRDEHDDHKNSIHSTNGKCMPVERAERITKTATEVGTLGPRGDSNVDFEEGTISPKKDGTDKMLKYIISSKDGNVVDQQYEFFASLLNDMIQGLLPLCSPMSKGGALRRRFQGPPEGEDRPSDGLPRNDTCNGYKATQDYYTTDSGFKTHVRLAVDQCEQSNLYQGESAEHILLLEKLIQTTCDRTVASLLFVLGSIVLEKGDTCDNGSFIDMTEMHNLYEVFMTRITNLNHASPDFLDSTTIPLLLEASFAKCSGDLTKVQTLLEAATDLVKTVLCYDLSVPCPSRPREKFEKLLKLLLGQKKEYVTSFAVVLFQFLQSRAFAPLYGVNSLARLD